MNSDRSTSGNGHRDPAALEREVNQTRAEMNDTLNALERKLTAGQLLDQCLKFFGRSGTEIGASLGKSLKENPLPILLTATGIGWMMYSPGRETRKDSRIPNTAEIYGLSGEGESTTAGTLTQARDRVSEGMSRVSEGMSRAGNEIKSRAAEAREGIAEGVSRMGERARYSAAAAREQLSESRNSAKEAVSDTFNRTADLAQTQYDRACDAFNSMLEEQPLVLGALGLAIGAAIGALLPATEQEDRLMGAMSDKAMAKAKETGADLYEKGRQTAKQSVEGLAQH